MAESQRVEHANSAPDAPSGAVAPSRRIASLDHARGIAVVLMIGWHTADGWLASEARDGVFVEVVRALGGLAAPLFLLLAGVSAGLRLETTRDRSATRRALLARGAQLVVLGYALRFQFWLLDSLGVAEPGGLERVLLPLGAGLYFTLSGIERLGARRAGGWRVLPGIALLVAAVIGLYSVAPDRTPGVLRVDVLHAIGASLVVVAIALRTRARPLVLTACAIAIATAAPTLAIALPIALPPPLADWIAERPNSTALFPLAPWLAYALAGAALGVELARARADADRARTLTWLAVLGGVTAIATHEALPIGSALTSAVPALHELFRLGSTLGIALVILRAIHPVRRDLPVLGTLGRASLLAYWLHLTFAFGILSRPFHRSLEPIGWAIGTAALVALMWALAQIRSGIGDALRDRATMRERFVVRP